MNATPMNPTSGNAVQPASQSGKPADAGTPDVPFSQVLSSEIAHNRKADAPKENSDAGAKPDPAARPGDTSVSKTDSTQQAKAGEKARPDEKTAQGKDDAPPAEDAAVAPETLLALAINPDTFRPVTAPAKADVAPIESVPAQDAAAVAVSARGKPDVAALGAHQGKPLPATQAGQKAGQLTGDEDLTQKPEPRRTGREDVSAAGAAGPARTTAPADAAATAFQGQLAAARHADVAKTGEALSDLVGNPAIRAVSHAQAEIRLAATDAASPRLAPAVGTTAWGQALGEKLVWMATGAQQTASLTLNPPNLGPLQIVVNVTNDQATASFFSGQPEVRHALESAFPRLREMMNDAGIQLGQATVSADTPQQHDTPDRQAQRIAPPFLGADPAATAGLQAAQAPVRQSGRGLVDTFA